LGQILGNSEADHRSLRFHELREDAEIKLLPPAPRRGYPAEEKRKPKNRPDHHRRSRARTDRTPFRGFTGLSRAFQKSPARKRLRRRSPDGGPPFSTGTGPPQLHGSAGNLITPFICFQGGGMAEILKGPGPGSVQYIADLTDPGPRDLGPRSSRLKTRRRDLSRTSGSTPTRRERLLPEPQPEQEVHHPEFPQPKQPKSSTTW